MSESEGVQVLNNYKKGLTSVKICSTFHFKITIQKYCNDSSGYETQQDGCYTEQHGPPPALGFSTIFIWDLTDLTIDLLSTYLH